MSLAGMAGLPSDEFVVAVLGLSLVALVGSGWYCFKPDSGITGFSRLLFFLGAVVWILVGAVASLLTGYWIAILNLTPVFFLRARAE